MTKRLVALGALVAIASSACASSTFDARPADVYTAALSQADVRSVLGDSNWWIGPPSFGVLPLDSATIDFTEKFSVTQEFIHLGTDERLGILYTVYDKTASATARMTALKNHFSSSPTTPKVGDDTLYTGAFRAGGAPFVYETFVRLSQMVVTIVWTRKSGGLSSRQLSVVATRAVDRLKKMNSAKVHTSLQAVDAKLLPPPGLDITYLGSAKLPIESWSVMTHTGLPGAVTDLMHTFGVTDFAFGDFALNNDTNMEVQTALMQFATTTAATQWANDFAPQPPDSNGIASDYIKTSGSAAAGQYHYLFVAGTYGGYMICKPSLDGEAASRECESPMERTALAWEIALSG